MKLKAGRASLVALLTAAFLISLFPPIYADSGTSQSQQAGNSSRPRRGKNGEPVNNVDNQTPKSADQEIAPEPGSPQDSKPETSKAASLPQSSQQKPAAAGDKSSQSTRRTENTTATREPAESQQQREAPPFDRPPIGAQGRSSGDSNNRRSEGSSPARQSPSYSDTDSSTRSDSRGKTPTQSQSSTGVQRDRFPESSTGTDVDPERTNRSGGRPPVLQRPADSRQRDDGGSPGARPPVLQRPTDSQARDEGEYADRNAGRRPASGQQPEAGTQPAGGEDEVIKLESTLINLPLLVSDRSGRYVPQLSARDFTLSEDGVQQTIASFGSEEVPFSVVLLLDVSPSVQGNIEGIQDAAIAFVRQLRSQDRVMVASFDRSIHYLSDFTNDRRELESAIRRVNTGSGTSVYDAVYETVAHKFRNVEGRKALILFSDGEDTTSSRASHDDAVNLVTESDVLVYGLRYPGNGGRGGVRVNPWPRSPIPGIQLPFPWPFPMPRRRRGPFRLSDPSATGNNAVPSPAGQWQRRNGRGGDFMADITAAGGGPVYDAEKISDLSRVANRIAEELRHVYVVSYYPTNPLSNGGYRSVRVSVKGRDDIAVRHRRGYNARSNGTAKPTI
ncbi:MAG: VWA domain-containing protein [Acidobacteriota bacterium]